MSSKVVELTEKELDREISRDGILIIDCWAEWCGACREFAPVFERIAQKYTEHRFRKLNIQLEKKALEVLGVEHIPTLILFKDGIMLFKQAGYYSEEKMVDIVGQAESVDMDEVRAHLKAPAEKRDLKEAKK